VRHKGKVCPGEHAACAQAFQKDSGSGRFAASRVGSSQRKVKRKRRVHRATKNYGTSCGLQPVKSAIGGPDNAKMRASEPVHQVLLPSLRAIKCGHFRKAFRFPVLFEVHLLKSAL
jgi:hypothetical protein